MVAVGFNPRNTTPPRIARRGATGCDGVAGWRHSCGDPWVETHGYHHMVAPRPGRTGWPVWRGADAARDAGRGDPRLPSCGRSATRGGGVAVCTGRGRAGWMRSSEQRERGDAGCVALPFHAVAERRPMVAVGFNPRNTTPPRIARRGATGVMAWRDGGIHAVPWVETHGYHHMVAPRPGTAGGGMRGDADATRDGAGHAAARKRDAGTRGIAISAVAERRPMVAVGFNPRNTTPPRIARRGATGCDGVAGWRHSCGRSATRDLFWYWIRGLKPTATITWSLRDPGRPLTPWDQKKARRAANHSTARRAGIAFPETKMVEEVAGFQCFSFQEERKHRTGQAAFSLPFNIQHSTTSTLLHARRRRSSNPPTARPAKAAADGSGMALIWRLSMYASVAICMEADVLIVCTEVQTGKGVGQ